MSKRFSYARRLTVSVKMMVEDLQINELNFLFDKNKNGQLVIIPSCTTNTNSNSEKL